MTFRECDACAAKMGSPVLCAGCLHNRNEIERMTGITDMNFDPTTNRIPFGLLTEAEQELLMAASESKGCQSYRNGEWREVCPGWGDEVVYRAKPAPVVKSSWHNVYPDADDDCDGMEVSPPYSDRDEADFCAGCDRIGVIRLDLIDGKLSVVLEE